MHKGVYTALVTPFREDLSFDEEGFLENLDFQLREGVQGVVVNGTTAESPTLTEEEQNKAIRLAVDYVKGRVPVLAGTGSASTQETVKKTLKAKELGAEGALVVTPYYNRPTQEGLFQHFHTLATTCRFPLLVYNIAGRTGQNLEISTLARLMDLPEIVGVKEASGSIPQAMGVIEQARPDFLIFSGDDNLTLPIVALGGHGVISVLSNLIPALIVELTRSALEGNFEKARELHYHLLPLFRAAFLESNPGPIKAMMNHAGLKAGSLRLPLVPVTPQTATQAIKCYEEILTLQS